MANSIQDLTNYMANSVQDLTNYWYSKLNPRLNYTTNGKAKLLVQRLTLRTCMSPSGRRQGDRDPWLAGGRMDLRHRQAAEGDLVTLSSTAIETAIAQCKSRWAMARGHRLNTSIVLAAVHSLSGLFRTVSAVEPSLCRPLPTLSPSLIGHLASVDVKQHETETQWGDHGGDGQGASGGCYRQPILLWHQDQQNEFSPAAYGHLCISPTCQRQPRKGVRGVLCGQFYNHTHPSQQSRLSVSRLRIWFTVDFV